MEEKKPLEGGGSKLTLSEKRKLRFCVSMIATAFIAAFLLAWIFYGDKYLFFQYYISSMGGVETKLGTPNRISRWIFSIGLTISAIFAVSAGILYLKRENWTALNWMKGISILLTGVGAFFTAFPTDQFQNIHRIGAGIFILAFDAYSFFAQYFRYQNYKILWKKGERKFELDKFYVILILLGTFIYLGVYTINITGVADLLYLLPGLQKAVIIIALGGAFVLNLDDF